MGLNSATIAAVQKELTSARSLLAHAQSEATYYQGRVNALEYVLQIIKEDTASYSSLSGEGPNPHKTTRPDE